MSTGVLVDMKTTDGFFTFYVPVVLALTDVGTSRTKD